MTKMVPFRRRTRADSLANTVTGLGTSRSRAAGVRTTPARMIRSTELDELWGSSMPRRIANQLPADAVTRPTIDGVEDVEALRHELESLRAFARLEEVGTRARHWGGAALWMVCDGVDDLGQPLDLGRVTRLRQLVIIDARDLHAASVDGRLLDPDPTSGTYLEPTHWRHTPRSGSGAGTGTLIHTSHLIRFFGDDVPEHLKSRYQWWGAPVLAAVWSEWSQEVMARKGGSEALYEIGGKTLGMDNLAELITSAEGRAQLDEILAAQEAAFSVLRAYLTGPGWTVEPFKPSLENWDKVYDRIAQALSAATGIPVTILFGQAPGGLSTDDASALRNWSARVRRYQQHVLTPALGRIIDVILASAEGAGVPAERWALDWAPYEEPDSKAEAETLKIKAEALNVAVQAGAITPAEMRASLADTPGVQLDDAAPPAPKPAETPDVTAPLDPPEDLDTPTPPPEDVNVQQAMPNGAQAEALVSTLVRYNTGELGREQARAALMFNHRLTAAQAEEALGSGPVTPPQPAGGDGLRADGLDPDGPALMLAAYPPREWADALVAAGLTTTPPERLHLTLIYLGRVDLEHLGRVVAALPAIGRELWAVDVDVTGPAVWQGEQWCHVLLLGGLGLAAMRTALVDRLGELELVTPQRHDFIPHVTLGYYPRPPSRQLKASIEAPTPGPWPIERLDLVSDDEVLASVQLTGAAPSWWGVEQPDDGDGLDTDSESE